MNICKSSYRVPGPLQAQQICCSLFKRRSKKTLKLRVTSLCGGIPPVTGGFPPYHIVFFSSLFHYHYHYFYYFYYYYYYHYYYYFNVILIQIEIGHFLQFYVITKLWKCSVPKRGQDGRNYIICRPSGRSMTAATALMDFPFSRQQYTNSNTKDTINYCLDIL